MTEVQGGTHSKLAIASLITGLLGVIFLPFSLVAIGLGAGALVSLRKNPGRRGKRFALTGIALFALALPINGIIGVFAVPAFVRYARRSKAMEARMNLVRIREGVDRYMLGKAGGVAVDDVEGFPAIERTPLEIPCGSQEWPVDASPLWKRIGFPPHDEVSYSYEVARPTAPEYRLRAYGNLDCDQTESVFELVGHVKEGNIIGWEKQLHIDDEF